MKRQGTWKFKAGMSSWISYSASGLCNRFLGPRNQRLSATADPGDHAFLRLKRKFRKGIQKGTAKKGMHAGRRTTGSCLDAWTVARVQG